MRAGNLLEASLLASLAVVSACATHAPEPARTPAPPATVVEEPAAEPPPTGFRWRDGAEQLRARSVALASLMSDPADRSVALVTLLRALDPADPRVPILLERLASAVADQPPPSRGEAHEVNAFASRALFVAERLLQRGERERAAVLVEGLAAAPPPGSEERATLARLLVRLGARDRALTLAVPVRDPTDDAESDDVAEELPADDAGEAGSDEDEEVDDEVLAAIASEEAMRGDVGWVTREALPRLSVTATCQALAALGTRHAREGRSEAAERAWASIRPHLAEHGEPEGATATAACLVAEARARLGQGDRDRAAIALASIGLEDDEAACRLLVELRREVDPTLLDAAVEVAVRASPHVLRHAWDGCPTTLAEALVRRGDPQRAMSLVARWRGNGARGSSSLTDGPEWPVLLRLGHLAPHEVVGLPPAQGRPAGGIEAELELARILDESPDQPLDRAAFDASFPPVANALLR